MSKNRKSLVKLLAAPVIGLPMYMWYDIWQESKKVKKLSPEDIKNEKMQEK